MEQAIQGFITYLHNVKKKSLNTELSYKRDLTKMLDPKLYIGRCPEQVTAFIEKVKPLLEGVDTEAVEINV